MPDIPSQRASGAHLLQISVTRSGQLKAIVPATLTTSSRRANELASFRSHMATVAQGGSFSGMNRFSPHVVAMSPRMHAWLEDIHLVLAKAYADLAARWFSDEGARFPQRMPLNPPEEELLRWVCGEEFPVRKGEPPAGCWRTDMLFGLSPDGEEPEAPYICEVNARLPVNAVVSSGLHGEVVGAMCPGVDEMQPQESYDDFIGQFLQRLDTSKPLFIVRDRWPGSDSRILQAAYTARTQQETFAVRPQDLELRPDEGTPTGNSLWDKASGRKVDQWISELLQDEWASMPQPVARHVSLTPINDLRTVFLLHDKRFLGIITTELPEMVARGTLTRREASLLAASIPETLIPGSPDMLALLEACTADPTIKDWYLYKPCRDGSGKGLELGRNISQEEWLGRLRTLADPMVRRPDQGAAVVQRLVEHHWYDMMRHETPDETDDVAKKYHLIGSMFIWDCKKYSIGCWRLGAEKHVGWKEGLVMGTLVRPEWPLHDKEEDDR